MNASTEQAAPEVASAVAERLTAALRWAEEAGNETLKFFRNSSLDVDRKGDGSPVTAADRASETLLRERIAELFPDDAILGEEFGETPGTSGYRWVLDPIDGTKSFIHGVPLYTTLIAVLEDKPEGETGESLLGIIHSPATRETVWAPAGGQTWYRDGDAEPVKAQVSDTDSLEKSLFLTTDVDDYDVREAGDATEMLIELAHKSRVTRTWGDAYGYLMVATGRAEVMIDPALSLWDAAALQPILEGAGGSFTDWQGNPTIHSNEAVATNAALKETILGMTKGR